MRLTTRKLMLIVAMIAMGFSGVRGCFYILEEVNEPFGQAIETTQSWDFGSSATVIIDCFEGNIDVVPPKTDW